MSLFLLLNPKFNTSSEPVIFGGGSGGGGLNWKPTWNFGKLVYKVKVDEIILPLEKPKRFSFKKPSSLDLKYRAFEKSILKEKTHPISSYLREQTQEVEKLSNIISFLTEGAQVLKENIKKKTLNTKEEENKKLLETLKKEQQRILAELKIKIRERAELEAFILNQYEEEALLVFLLLN